MISYFRIQSFPSRLISTVQPFPQAFAYSPSIPTKTTIHKWNMDIRLLDIKHPPATCNQHLLTLCFYYDSETATRPKTGFQLRDLWLEPASIDFKSKIRLHKLSTPKPSTIYAFKTQLIFVLRTSHMLSNFISLHWTIIKSLNYQCFIK